MMTQQLSLSSPGPQLRLQCCEALGEAAGPSTPTAVCLTGRLLDWTLPGARVAPNMHDLINHLRSAPGSLRPLR
jgi:hypothetical protein